MNMGLIKKEKVDNLAKQGKVVIKKSGRDTYAGVGNDIYLLQGGFYEFIDIYDIRNVRKLPSKEFADSLKNSRTGKVPSNIETVVEKDMKRLAPVYRKYDSPLPKRELDRYFNSIIFEYIPQEKQKRFYERWDTLKGGPIGGLEEKSLSFKR